MKPLWAIGDIHGCSEMLVALIHRTREIMNDGHYVFLGDYVGRGPSPRKTIANLINMVDLGYATALSGNHDRMLVEIYDTVVSNSDLSCIYKGWSLLFGKDIIKDYGSYNNIPQCHIDFLRKLKDHHATRGFCFHHDGFLGR